MEYKFAGPGKPIYVIATKISISTTILKDSLHSKKDVGDQFDLEKTSSCKSSDLAIKCATNLNDFVFVCVKLIDK